MDLRERSAAFVSEMNTPGVAIGGLSVGETKAQMIATLDALAPILPEARPRYLMGVGSPEDLVQGIRRGVDIFDCVLPTRLARHVAAMTRRGQMNLVNRQYRDDPRPLVEDCQCYACQKGHQRHGRGAGRGAHFPAHLSAGGRGQIYQAFLGQRHNREEEIGRAHV